MRVSCVLATMLLVILQLTVASQPVGAEESDVDAPPTIHPGLHAITLNAGLLSRGTIETEVSAEAVRTETQTGFIGSLSYAYWYRESWAFCVSVGVLDPGTFTLVRAGEVTSKSATVGFFLVGVAYYPTALLISPTLRGYGSVAVGPYVGSASNVRVGASVDAKSVSETALGLRIGAGLDWFLGKRFKTGIALGYHLVTDYSERIGADDNYSGPEVSLTFGVLFGKGH